VTSIFAASESTLASSPRLVGGVDIRGDAAAEERDADCCSVPTVMHERAGDEEAGDVFRSAMVAVYRSGRVVAVVWWRRDGRRTREFKV
jgi:hypothetical protein